MRLVDLREQVISFSKLTAKTRENIAVSVDLIVYAQVVDPKAATYEIATWQLGLEQLVVTTLRNWAEELKFDEVYSAREMLFGQLRDILDELASKWEYGSTACRSSASARPTVRTPPVFSTCWARFEAPES